MNRTERILTILFILAVPLFLILTGIVVGWILAAALIDRLESLTFDGHATIERAWRKLMPMLGQIARERC